MLTSNQHRSQLTQALRQVTPRLTLAAVLLAVPTWAAEAGFELPGLDGGKLSSAQLAEGPVIAVVWDPSSPACKEIVARVNHLESKWGTEARVVTIVSRGTAARAHEFLKGKNLEAPAFHDAEGAFAKRYGVSEVPWMVLLSRGESSFSGKLPIDPDPPIIVWPRDD